jgi:hypothetical protein
MHDVSPTPTTHSSSRLWRLGQLYSDDRAQRLLAGLALMALNVYAMRTEAHWNHYLALVIQLDLLTTALIGWCPLTLACRLNARKHP